MEASLFFEQLGESKNFATQIKFCDNFFLKRISHSYKNGDQISAACKRLMITDGQVNMKELAFHTNRSLHNLERWFTERVGVSPKTFARFKRFHRALSLLHHQKAWFSKDAFVARA